MKVGKYCWGFVFWIELSFRSSFRGVSCLVNSRLRTHSTEWCWRWPTERWHSYRMRADRRVQLCVSVAWWSRKGGAGGESWECSQSWRRCWCFSCFRYRVVNVGPDPDRTRCPCYAIGWRMASSPCGPRLGSRTISELFLESTADPHLKLSREHKSLRQKWAGT